MAGEPVANKMVSVGKHSLENAMIIFALKFFSKTENLYYVTIITQFDAKIPSFTLIGVKY